MDLSIIIATHNRLELTEQCLESLDHSVGKVAKYEIIIVDDCSTDGTREYLAELPPPYRVHLNEKKGNYAINNNRGAGLAQSDNLLFLNNDTSFESDFISPMMDGLDGLPDAGCIGNVQRIPATGRYDHFGVCFPKWHTPIHFGQHFVQKPELEGPYSRWAAVTAACMLVRKDIFFSVGGFDERYVNGCEDMDLCLKLHRAGYSHYVAHESEIFHHKGASPGRKDFNDQNLKIFKREWASYLEENVCPRDQKLAARSYLRSCWSFPQKTNLHKLSLSLGAAIKPSEPAVIRQPECWKLPPQSNLRQQTNRQRTRSTPRPSSGISVKSEQCAKPSYALATLQIGENPFFEQVRENYRRVCERYNWKLEIISERQIGLIPIRKRIRRIQFEKFQIGRLLDTYDRILYLDSDILLNASFPNIFELVPADSFGCVMEDVGPLKWKRDEERMRAQRRLGRLPDWRQGYFNSGMFVVSQMHKPIFSTSWGNLAAGRWPDQTTLNYQVRAQGFIIHELPAEFNYMPELSSEWESSQCRRNAHVVHYAGPEAKPAMLEDLKFLED